MKKIKRMFFLVFYLFFLTFYPYSIVFIHIGPHLPVYMYDALMQARLFNKSCAIYLLANQKALYQFNDMHNLDVTLISLEILHKTKVHQKFIELSKLSRTMDNGLWFYASERFLYLNDFMQHYNKKNIFHIENDTMLYVDLKTLEPIFLGKYPGIGAVFDNDNRCIPCFVYISNKNIMHELAEYFVEYSQKLKTDMDVLAIFRKKKGDKLVGALPIIMPSYKKKHILRNRLGNKPSDPSLYSQNFELFQSIFDGAALGQYLGGIDPKNGLSQPGFINERCFLNPSHLQFDWSLDELGRKIPFVIFGNEMYKINNLHIHSKNLKKFSS